ncbi:hypothetical protein I552_1239 [Mycobacterium xenopi 3993]|nr:hypothetical protein I552_1239 [Mycobacterium xenopi 3993]
MQQTQGGCLAVYDGRATITGTGTALTTVLLTDPKSMPANPPRP